MASSKSLQRYPDARAVTARLDDLIKQPVYSISDQALKRYETEYYEKKCARSKAEITVAKEVIPGGVQHNLAFNYPFPLGAPPPGPGAPEAPSAAEFRGLVPAPAGLAPADPGGA